MGITDRPGVLGHFHGEIHPLPDDETMTLHPAHSHHLTLHRFAGRPASRFVLHLYLRWIAVSFVILGTISVAAVTL